MNRFSSLARRFTGSSRGLKQTRRRGGRPTFIATAEGPGVIATNMHIHILCIISTTRVKRCHATGSPAAILETSPATSPATSATTLPPANRPHWTTPRAMRSRRYQPGGDRTAPPLVDRQAPPNVFHTRAKSGSAPDIPESRAGHELHRSLVRLTRPPTLTEHSRTLKGTPRFLCVGPDKEGEAWSARSGTRRV